MYTLDLSFAAVGHGCCLSHLTLQRLHERQEWMLSEHPKAGISETAVDVIGEVGCSIAAERSRKQTLTGMRLHVPAQTANVIVKNWGQS
jgi:hypothetical protein